MDTANGIPVSTQFDTDASRQLLLEEGNGKLEILLLYHSSGTVRVLIDVIEVLLQYSESNWVHTTAARERLWLVKGLANLRLTSEYVYCTGNLFCNNLKLTARNV